VTRALRWIGFIALTSSLIACSGEDQVSPTTTSTAVDSTLPPRPSDGVLTIGALVPAEILTRDQHDEFVAVVDSAVRVINANGGYNGQPIRLLWADETESLDATRDTVSQLVEQGAIDVLIGPSSSALAGPIALDVIERGVGLCSPAATSALLSELPDQGMMLRTTQGDAAIARAMIDLTADTGFAAAALVYADDPYGRAFAELLHQFIDERGLNQTVPGSPEENYDYPFTIDTDGTVSNADELAGLASRVVLFVGTDDSARSVLPLLKEKRIIVPDALAAFDTSTIIVEDPVAGDEFDSVDQSFAASGNIIQGVAQDLLAGSTALVAGLRNVDPELNADVTGDVPLLVATVDCLNVIALTAIEAGSDDARTFMVLANETTNTGTRCRSFLDCINALNSELTIDYDGSSGELSLDTNGDATSGPLIAFDFGAEGRAVITRQLRVTTPS
jgi:branched-chain amino acid transport system substrate-binding protein